MKEKSRTFLLLYISFKEIADNIEYRANSRALYIKQESADALNIEKPDICWVLLSPDKELHTIKNAFFNHN